MSFIEKIRYVPTGKMQDDKPEDTRQYDLDGEGQPLYREDIIQFVKDSLERRKSERKPLEQQWILNSNFLIRTKKLMSLLAFEILFKSGNAKIHLNPACKKMIIRL